jgi:hypothetical protein
VLHLKNLPRRSAGTKVAGLVCEQSGKARGGVPPLVTKRVRNGLIAKELLKIMEKKSAQGHENTGDNSKEGPKASARRNVRTVRR